MIMGISTSSILKSDNFCTLELSLFEVLEIEKLHFTKVEFSRNTFFQIQKTAKGNIQIFIIVVLHFFKNGFSAIFYFEKGFFSGAFGGLGRSTNESDYGNSLFAQQKWVPIVHTCVPLFLPYYLIYPFLFHLGIHLTSQNTFQYSAFKT